MRRKRRKNERGENNGGNVKKGRSMTNRSREIRRGGQPYEPDSGAVRSCSGSSKAGCRPGQVTNFVRLSDDEPLGPFLATFEAQMRCSRVPVEQWKVHLLGQLDKGHCIKLEGCIANEDSTYDDIV